jgi:NosR/NirI family transcriptional regulator, nitrous oxide reductase regulator
LLITFKTMYKIRLHAALYHYYLIFVLMAAIAISGGRNFLFTKDAVEVKVGLPEIQEIYPAATLFEMNRFGVYEVYAASGQQIGTALLSSNYSQQFGYAGIVPLLIGMDQNLIISKIVVLPNNETGDYVAAIYSDKFIGRWQGVSLEEAMQMQVDGVSGATHTSKAVIAGVRHTASHVMNAEVPVVGETKLWSSIKNLLFLAMVLASVVMAYKKGRARFRTVYLLFVLLIMGLMLNNLLSARLLNGWLLEGFVWRVHWQSIVVFGLALALSLAGKRKFYCNYLCPMGALQELTNKITPFRKRKLPGRFWGISTRELYLTLIAGALLTGFRPELAYLEPFMFFSFNIIGIGMILFGVAVVVLSLFFYQPWCSVCPTGCLMDTIPFNKAKYTESKPIDHAEK